MKIIQISDLHINENINIEKEKKIIKRLFNKIEGQLTSGEENLIIFCGDLFNKGDNSTKDKIKELLYSFKNTFEKYNFKYLFVPGNHDLVNESFDNFNELINEFDTSNYFDFNGVLFKEMVELNIILMNTTFHKKHEFGKINYDKLEEILNEIPNKPTVLVGHHTLISRYDGDASNIRDAYRLTKILENYPNIISYIHGHTHSYNDLTLGENCKVVGVGPYHANVFEIPRQFNFLDIKAGSIHSISNFRYNSDTEEFSETSVYQRTNFNTFAGNSFADIHKSVIETTKLCGCIHNFNFNYSNSFTELGNELKKHYATDLHLADLWQQPEQPDELYYNHGKYMRDGSSQGISFVIDELKKKATSSRALIPLINLKMILHSGDNFLPSFDLIQFGFQQENKEKLYVTLYLRALEVNHFLKINFCELYLLIKKIEAEILSLKDVHINILAFKAQYKEKYGCFQKPKLDITTEAKLSRLFENRPKEIKNMLEEKLSFSETVIENKGIISLCNVLDVLVEDNANTSTFTFSTLLDMQTHLKDLKILYEEIADLRRKTSDYKKINEKEDKITAQIKHIINYFD